MTDCQITIDATPEEARFELARWLGSGEYPQAKGVLCRRSHEGDEAYCCLGVASELGVALGLVEKTIEHCDDPTLADQVEYGGEQATLGTVLQEFFGMTSTGQFRQAGPHVGELTNLNDHQDKTFEEIARVVRTAEFVAAQRYD